MLWIFFARKIRRLWPGSNPRSWVPEASMLTTRPPKPPSSALQVPTFLLLYPNSSLQYYPSPLPLVSIHTSYSRCNDTATLNYTSDWYFWFRYSRTARTESFSTANTARHWTSTYASLYFCSVFPSLPKPHIDQASQTTTRIALRCSPQTFCCFKIFYYNYIA